MITHDEPARAYVKIESTTVAKTSLRIVFILIICIIHNNCFYLSKISANESTFSISDTAIRNGRLCSRINRYVILCKANMQISTEYALYLCIHFSIAFVNFPTNYWQKLVWMINYSSKNVSKFYVSTERTTFVYYMNNSWPCRHNSLTVLLFNSASSTDYFLIRDNEQNKNLPLLPFL